MEREQIKEIMRDIFGRSFYMKDLGEWVSMKCPLAQWTHEKGHDGSPSAGVSVNRDGASGFNCLSGGTLVRTLGGLRPIEELAGGEHVLQMPDGSWQSCPVRFHGEQPLVRVELTRNGRTRELWATRGHRWFRKGKKGYVECTTLDLTRGDRLQSVAVLGTGLVNIVEHGFLHGAMYGDGTAVKAKRNHAVLKLFGAKMQLAEKLVANNVRRVAATASTPEHVFVSGPYARMKSLPGTHACRDYLLSFLAGWIATDGCVDERGNVSISSGRIEPLEWLRDTFAPLGVETFGIYGQEREGFGSWSTVYTLRFVASSLDRSLFVRPDQLRRFESRKAAYERLRWQVSSVEDSGFVAPVYCPEVPEYGAFVLDGGLVTGNCFTCGTSGTAGPLSKMLSLYSDYSGEDLGDLIDEIEEGEFLGPRTLQSYDSLLSGNLHDIAMPIDEGLYMDLYDSAVGHPYLAKRGISKATTRKLELLYDPKDPADREPRILFPVRGPDGLLYGFSGRATRPTARLKVRDYCGLAKAQCVLGSHLADQADRIIVVEGLVDYAMCHEHGEAGCAMMHANLTEYQAEIVRNIGKPTYIMYDNDKAGNDAYVTAYKQLTRHVPLFKTTYPKVRIEDKSQRGWHWLKDPGELLKEELDEMLSKAQLV